jgi:hypothetical protein
MDNITIVVAYNALTGWGAIEHDSHAYQPFFEAVLIRENGIPHDRESLLSALEFEINRRLKTESVQAEQAPLTDATDLCEMIGRSRKGIA